MAYSLDVLHIDSAFEAEDIYDVNFQMKPNAHSVLSVVCSVKGNGRMESLVRNLQGKRFNLLTYAGEQKKLLFSGIIKACKAVSSYKINTMSLRVLGWTIMLDQVRRTKLFQDGESTCQAVFDNIMWEYSEKTIFNKEDTPIKNLLFQYKETDWQFLKRVSGLRGGVLVPLCRENGMRLCYGLPRSAKEIVLKEDFYASGHRLNDKGAEYCIEGMYHDFSSDEEYELGTVVGRNGSSFVICEKAAKTSGAELIFYYRVCREESIKTNKFYNEEIRGLVVSGEVTDRKGERIFVKFPMDSGLERKRYGFEWLPITGNILYCMPEIGSKVKIYFGNRDEGKNVFALECEGGGCASNEVKGLITKDQKAALLKDNGVELRAGNQVRLSGETIAFGSSNLLSMTAGKKVEIRSEMVEINACKDISIQKK